MYITFEWIVWTWKSTQSLLLQEFLMREFPEKYVLHVREPGSTGIAESIRTLAQGTKFEEEMDPICEAYLYAAARAQLLKTKVKETLDWWGYVVADRCVISSLAYQWYARWVWIDKVMSINKEAITECIPDVVIYLEADIDKSLARTFDADGDKFETFGKGFFLKVERGYRQVSKMNEFSQQRHVVNASGTKEEVHQRIREVLSSIWVI